MNDASPPKGPLLCGLDLNLVRALHALLREESISHAAQVLGITQAAASNALRRLREHFRDELRVRQGSRMELTPLALILQERAAEAMWAISRALEEPRAFDPALAQGVFRVATSDHVEAILLEPLARKLRTRAPGLRLRVEPFVADSGTHLLRGELDAVIAPRAALPESLRAVTLREEPYLAVLRQGHPALRRGLNLARFASLEHVAVSPSGGRSFAVDAALAALGQQREIARVVPNFSQALLLVAESDLIAVLPRSFAERFAARLRLCLVPVPLALAPARLALGWSPARHAEPLHAWMRQQLAESAHLPDAPPSPAQNAQQRTKKER
jgi:DNA-binding transcriptional LysR family regulator